MDEEEDHHASNQEVGPSSQVVPSVGRHVLFQVAFQVAYLSNGEKRCFIIYNFYNYVM